MNLFKKFAFIAIVVSVILPIFSCRVDDDDDTISATDLILYEGDLQLDENSSISMEQKGSKKLKATILPKNATARKITWTVKDENTAMFTEVDEDGTSTVDENGDSEVTLNAKDTIGKTTISAKIGNIEKEVTLVVSAEKIPATKITLNDTEKNMFRGGYTH